MGVATLTIAVAGLVATAWMVTSFFQFERASDHICAAYLAAAAEVILLTEFMSLPRWVSLRGYLAGEAVLAAVVVPLYLLRRERSTFSRARGQLPAVSLTAVLLAILSLGIVYELVLALTVPPNNWDALWYHLSRAALWRQDHSLRYVVPVSFAGINAYPPNAEIGILYSFVLLGSDRVAGTVQLTAYGVLLVAVYAIARRLGHRPAAALLAAFVCGTLPLIALEASTAQNDIVVASFVVVAASFAMGKRRAELALSGVALGLAVGTKLTALLALPGLVVLALACQRRRQWPTLATAWCAGILVFGSFGYVQNLVSSGRLLGPPSLENGLRASASAGTIVRTIAVVLFRFLDLSGVLRVGIPGLLAVGAVITALGVVLALQLPTRPRRPAVTAAATVGLVACSALVPVAAALVARSFVEAAEVAGRPGLQSSWYGIRPATHFVVNRSANEDWSFFGPLGLVVLFTAAVTLLRRRGPSAPERALAVFFAIYLGALALTLTYNEYLGRFLITPVALACPLVASLWYRRPVRWAIAATGTMFLLLSLASNENKSVAVPLVGYAGGGHVHVDAGFSAWGASRVAVQSVTRPDMEPVLEAVAADVPAHSSVALAVSALDWVYPYFGRGLARRIDFLDGPVTGSALHGTAATWVVAAPGRLRERCIVGWDVKPVGAVGWKIAHRDPRVARC